MEEQATTDDVTTCLTEKCQQAEQKHGERMKELEELQIIRANEAEDLIQRCQGSKMKNEQLKCRLEQALLSTFRGRVPEVGGMRSEPDERT